MPLIEEDAIHYALDGLLHGCVVEDDVGGLATQLECHLLLGARGRAGDGAADCRRPGERDFVDTGVVDEKLPGVASAGDDVDDALRQVGLLQDLREQQRRERSGLRGLQYDGVAGGQRGRDLPREHQQRKVPRDDLRRDPEGARSGPESGVVELVGPARVVEEPGSDEWNVDIPALLDGFAVVEALSDRKLPRALLNESGDAEQVLAAVGPA